MTDRLKYSLKYLRYILFAKHKKGHGIHSPFLFDLIMNVLNNKKIPKELDKVISLHKELKKSKDKINFDEIGAGSKYIRNQQITIGKLIKRSSVSIKYGKLLFYLVDYFQSKNILEIGTSIGISAAYLGQRAEIDTFKTIEGVQEKSEYAIRLAQKLNQNTEFITANFDSLLDTVLGSYKKLDLVFFDGNHQKESTLRYFNSCLKKVHNDTIFVFDDIHWSSEMEQAWSEIKKHEKVRLSIDIFRMGLIFFKKELSYEQYVIKF